MEKKFTSTKSPITTFLLLGAGLLPLLITLFEGTMEGILIGLGSSMLLLGFFSWLWFGTWYKISEGKLIIRSGPAGSEIPVNRIRKIEKNTTLWGGWRPALGTKGLIIRYNTYDEVYISPVQSEEFLAALLEHNPGIEVVESGKRAGRA